MRFISIKILNRLNIKYNNLVNYKNKMIKIFYCGNLTIKLAEGLIEWINLYKKMRINKKEMVISYKRYKRRI